MSLALPDLGPLPQGEGELPATRGRSDASTFQGHLNLICSASPAGPSCISHQSFRAPFHISKPYWDGNALNVQVINPTAGLFGGDRLRSEISVESGATLRITNPSATRVHTMPEGRAEVLQRFRVARGGSLVFIPSMLVPQRGSCLRQHTQMTVEPGGELVYADSMSPGRVASGEVFAFRELRMTTELYDGPRWNACENYRLCPGDGVGLEYAGKDFQRGYYACCHVVTSRIEANDGCWEAVSAFHGPDAWVGVSRLAIRGWSVRLLCRDSLHLRRTLRAVLGILAASIPELRGLERFMP